MRVVDLYCGAGGFSEGFQLAGFEVILGIDNWSPAIKTFIANHPSANSIQADIFEISQLPDTEFHNLIPDSEIIIGSPPCVNFSSSNKSGKAEKKEGIRLIEAFLRIVARKKWKRESKLRYWILENVPNSKNYIKEKYMAKELGIESTQTLNVKGPSSDVYDLVRFGVPSKRKRFLCGEFPRPSQDIEARKTLGEMLDSLRPTSKGLIEDINYNFSMAKEFVTDWDYVQPIASYQASAAKRLKTDKGYMGKMAFPEDLSRPSRAILATMTFSARESMILSDEKCRFRAPTIREVSTLMSFPINYIFYGASPSTKYRLVGNAVPPKFGLRLAQAILNQEGRGKAQIGNFVTPRVPVDGFVNLNGMLFPESVEKRKRYDAKFTYHIPYLTPGGYRVELKNSFEGIGESPIWKVIIHKGQGKSARVLNVPKKNVERIFKEHPELLEWAKLHANMVGSAKDFQENYCIPTFERKKRGLIGPFELLQKAKEFLARFAQNLSRGRLNYQLMEMKVPESIMLGYAMLSEVTSELNGKE